MLIQKPELFTAQQALTRFSTFYSTDQGLSFAAMAIVLVPPLVAFVLLRSRLIHGFSWAFDLATRRLQSGKPGRVNEIPAAQPAEDTLLISAPGEIRTPDAGLRTASLYPLSYGGGRNRILRTSGR